MGDPRAVLERWAAKTDQEVTLASGMRAKVRLPSPEVLARNDRMPQELRSVALQFAVGSVRLNELDEPRKLAYLQLREALVADELRALWDEPTGTWVPVNVDASELRALGLPEEDLTQLEAIAERRLSPGQVTALSLERQGLLTANEVAAKRQQEAAATVDGWRPFSGQQGRPGAGGDSAAVRPVTSTGLPTGDGPSAGAGN